MRSITLKLVLAFLAVSLVGIAWMAVSAGQITERVFGSYLDAHNQGALINRLSDFYTINDGWQGVEAFIISQSFVNEFGRGFVLTGEKGSIIFPDSRGFPEDQRLRQKMGDEVPIFVDGQVVGAIITGSNRLFERPFVAEIFNRFYRNMLIGALGAIVVSLLLGLFLARTLTRTLRELKAATRAVAKGDLTQRVTIRSHDELGDLALSVNKMTADLEHSRDLRRKMIADIAHDLRTPLSVILGHAEALNEGALPPNSDTFYIIHDEAQRLNRLVEDLRTLSLSDAGELPLSRTFVSLEELLERVVAAYTPRARQKNIALQVHLAPSLPEVSIDQDRMIQVLGNLLDNALRYTPVDGSITLSAGCSSDHVELCVQDSGPGIPAEDLPFVFDRFYRGDKSRRRGEGGSGLGLAIAKSIVELHGGVIRVESEPGKGVVFIIELLDVC
ncbi:MAG: ATP-binding protein [Anaerolineales bacterium]